MATNFPSTTRIRRLRMRMKLGHAAAVERTGRRRQPHRGPGLVLCLPGSEHRWTFACFACFAHVLLEHLLLLIFSPGTGSPRRGLGWGVEGSVISKPRAGWSWMTTHRRIGVFRWLSFQDKACNCEITNSHGSVSVSCKRSRACICRGLGAWNTDLCWMCGLLSKQLIGVDFFSPSFVLDLTASLTNHSFPLFVATYRSSPSLLIHTCRDIFARRIGNQRHQFPGRIEHLTGASTFSMYGSRGYHHMLTA
jgi:hypothetical protein